LETDVQKATESVPSCIGILLPTPSTAWQHLDISDPTHSMAGDCDKERPPIFIDRAEFALRLPRPIRTPLGRLAGGSAASRRRVFESASNRWQGSEEKSWLVGLGKMQTTLQ